MVVKNDGVIFIDDVNREGRTKMPSELVRELTELAKEMNTNRSRLVRRALTSLVLYLRDARAFGKLPTITEKVSIEVWLHEREQIASFSKNIHELRIKIEETTNPTDKINLLALQNEQLANMTNLLNKQVI